jgi:hypothetical protein
VNRDLWQPPEKRKLVESLVGGAGAVDVMKSKQLAAALLARFGLLLMLDVASVTTINFSGTFSFA